MATSSQGGSFGLVEGGTIPADNIARWNGVAWSPLGSGTNGTVRALAVLPNGDLAVGGNFTTAGGVAAQHVARWNGATWSSFGSGTDASVNALAMHPMEGLFVGGTFTQAGGNLSARLGRVVSTCPATAVAHGRGCSGANSLNVLNATTPPWVDAMFRAKGTGLPMTSIVLTLTSISSIPQGLVPLALAFPQAGAGCDVLTAPDILGVLFTTTGVAQSELLLPNTPPLVGVTFYHQMVPIEVDAQGAWVSVTATNALQLQAGSF